MPRNIKYFIGLFVISGVIGGAIAGFAYLTNQYAPQSSAGQAKINLTFSPATLSLNANENKIISLLIQPADAGNNISGIDLTFVAGGQANIIDISSPETFPEGDKSPFTQVVRTVSPTQSRISYVVARPSDQLPQAAKVNIIIQGAADGVGTLSINQTSAQIVGKITGYAYELNPFQGVNITIGTGSPTNQPSPTAVLPTAQPTAGGNAVSLIFKLRFQGIIAKPAESKKNLTLRLKLGQNSSSGFRNYQVPVAYGNDGVWMGKITINEPPGSGYYMLIKGPFHLQKKICDAAPTYNNGVYRCSKPNITLASGENVIDMTGILFSVGDVRVNGSDQDGFINSSDLAYIREKMGRSDSEALDQADINLDGIVDTQDYSLVIETLSSKYDEDE